MIAEPRRERGGGRVTVHHLDEVRRKIADLRKIERVLTEMAAQCDGGIVPKCPVIDALFDRSVGAADESHDGPSARAGSRIRRGSPQRHGA